MPRVSKSSPAKKKESLKKSKAIKVNSPKKSNKKSKKEYDVIEDIIADDDFVTDDDFVKDENEDEEEDFLDEEDFSDEDDFIEEDDSDKKKKKKGKTPKKRNRFENTENLTEREKKAILISKRSNEIFKSAISPSRSKPSKFLKRKFSPVMKSAEIPKVNNIIKPIKVPRVILNQNTKSVTPKGVKEFKENIENISKILDEINIMMLAKEEGGKKNTEYNLNQLKSFISRMGLPQNSDRNTAVRKILSQLENYNKITREEYKIINDRLEKKENKKTLMLTKKK